MLPVAKVFMFLFLVVRYSSVLIDDKIIYSDNNEIYNNSYGTVNGGVI